MVMNPYSPGGGSWFTPTGGTSWDANYAVSPATAMQLASRPSTPNAGGGAQNDDGEAARWDQYVSGVQAALQAAAGQQNKLEYEKLTRQYADAEKGRQNAYRIAELSAKTSRYGVDRNTETELARLKETQRQFDANHGLEMQKFGLEQQRFGLSEAGVTGTYQGRPTQAAKEFEQTHGLNLANAYTQYAQTYDNPWLLKDFEGALGNVGQGRAPAAVATSDTQPHAKTWQDFAALSGFNLPTVQAGQTMPGGVAMAGGYMTRNPDGSMTPNAPGQTGAGTDPRLSAASAVMKALPPSEGAGHDLQDYAALNAIKSLYFGRNPRAVAALGSQRQKVALSGLARLGYNPNQIAEDYDRSRPGQGRANAA